MNGSRITVSAVIAIASRRSPCSKACMARSDPQPGQYNPVKECTGHGGKTRECAGSNSRNKTAPLVARTTSAIIIAYRRITMGNRVYRGRRWPITPTIAKMPQITVTPSPSPNEIQHQIGRAHV